MLAIGDMSFATKKAALEHFRAVLGRSKVGETIDGPDHGQLLALLNRHPDALAKIGVGVAHFIVDVAAFGSRCFVVVRADGSSTDWSYRTAVAGVGRSLLEEFLAAARFEIAPEMQAFKREYFDRYESGMAPCQTTGQMISIHDAHVDHQPPHTFRAICDRFLDDEKMVPSYEWLSAPADNQHSCRFTNETLRQRFIDLHRRLADLQIVEASVNISAGSYGYRSATKEEAQRGLFDDP
uniref:DUF3223 domain-containing protein n=1 Tax=viral metagenome TaxID=1070528 RepID=A0A6M3JAD2_9ZZZZ